VGGIGLENIIKENNLEIEKASNPQEVISQYSNPDLHNINLTTFQHEEINLFKGTSHVYLCVSCTLQSNFKEQLDGSILKDDFKPIFT
jgi:hypothetical protein